MLLLLLLTVYLFIYLLTYFILELISSSFPRYNFLLIFFKVVQKKKGIWSISKIQEWIIAPPSLPLIPRYLLQLWALMIVFADKIYVRNVRHLLEERSFSAKKRKIFFSRMLLSAAILRYAPWRFVFPFLLTHLL